MRRVRSWISWVNLVLLTLLPGIGPAALAASAPAALLSMSLGDMTRQSGVVFAGTVTDVRTAAAPGTIITRVTFHDLAFGKGRVAGDSLVLNVNGGTLLGRTVEDNDEPGFRPGQRCIVFARGDLGSYANHYRAVVGGWQGVFYEEFDSTAMKVSLRQPLSVPVAGIRGEGIVVADGNLAFTRMTEKDFLAAVGKIAEHPVPTATDSL